MNIAVIGGGPAGLVSAGICSQSGAAVILIEKNAKLGKKLYITGKGRCNLTNNCSVEDFLLNVPTNPRFLNSAIRAFTPTDTISFFEKLNCPLKTERGNRVFPESDKSSDIISAFERFLHNNKVKVKLNTACQDIKINEKQEFEIQTDKGVATVQKLIICSGGASYSSTGSTGELFSIIKRLGHTVIDLKPALCPLILEESCVKDLAGLSLKNVTVEAIFNKKKLYSGFGEMLFTHEGVSGPLILSMSSYINKADIKNVEISIDLKPAIDEKTLLNRINRDFLEAKNKLFKNSLNELLPKSLIPIIINLSGISPELQTNSVTAVQRRSLVQLLKNLTFKVKSLDTLESAIITSGGVSVKEINPSTMESKLIKGLYFAGEVIDTDALTGGFNIQIALATGFLAGTNACK